MMDASLKLKLLVLGIWLIFIYQTHKRFILGIKSQKWNKMKATVLLSSIDRFNGHYEPKIVFRYNLNGENFENDTYTFLGLPYITKKKALELSKSIPEGSEVDIYVSPKDGQTSVIVTGVHWTQYFSFVVLTIIFICIGFLGEILNFIWPGCQPNCT